jgi:CheY-like chemotaxis protein/two-component sensor histidine kinase
MGTLAAGVAHEINNPLAYVVASLEQLEEQLRAAPTGLSAGAMQETLEVLSEAREGAGRVRQIVRDLKTFSRADEGRLERIEVQPLIESAINMARNELKHRARLVTVFGRVPPVLANGSKLVQVFLNLLINAAQAIPAGRVEKNEVRVTTSTDAEGRARIEVRDTGTGVPAQLAARIFEPFVTSKRLSEGTGLGLSICREVVTALGGEIGFEGAPGGGTTFRVTLPAAAPATATTPSPARPPAKPPAADPSGRRGRVAIVDDEAGIRRAVGRSLANAHDVVLFESARVLADQVAAGERFDVILCDLMMPDMTGMELHQVLRSRVPEQADAMIFMTGGTFTPESRAFLEAVPNPRVEKPFEIAALRTLIRSRIA